MKFMETKIKRYMLELTEEQHELLLENATKNDTTMKDFILLAIAEKIERA